MRQLIAMFAVFGLVALIAFYVALAPLAASAPEALHVPVTWLDRGAAWLSAIRGRSAAVLALLGGGAVLGLIAAMFATGKREKSRPGEPVPAPGPVWRPEPLDEDRIASLRRRAGMDIAEQSQDADTGAVIEPEPGDSRPQWPSPVILARKMRDRDGTWAHNRSWLGGLPRLAGIEWPRGPQGVPLPFAAQIDLAELAGACPQSPLPREGSLAFFLGAGAVIAVPPGDHEFTDPPIGLAPAYEEGGTALPATPTRLSRYLFPFWPVEPIALSLSERPLDQAISDTVRRRFGEPSATPPSADGDTLWWYGVFHLTDRLHQALDGAAHAPQTEEQAASLATMVEAMDRFIASRDPWESLTAEERDLVVEILDEIHRVHGRFVQHFIPHSLAPLQALCIRAMISGAPEAFAALPEDVLTRIAGKYRVPAGLQHQIFGVEDEAGDDLLLLQLGYDDIMDWRWQGAGAYRFRISPQDAAAGRWDRVRLAFESD